MSRNNDWSQNGYYMQQVACENAVAVDSASDQGYVPEPWWEKGDDAFTVRDGQDAELGRSRSKNVSMRLGGFWRPVKGTRDRHARIQLIVEIILAALAVIAIGMFVRTSVFRLNSVMVEGNHSLSDDTVRAYANVKAGMDFLSLNDQAIAASISRSPQLELINVERHFPNQVTLHVYERTVAMYVRYCGMTYLLDNQGMVLGEMESMKQEPYYVCVEGLGIRGCTVGKLVSVQDAERLSVVHEMLREIRAMSLDKEIAELYLDSALEDLNLVTRSGYSVRLGAPEDIHAKLRAMQLVCAYLTENEKSGGTIDVTTPAQPTWLPGIA